MADLAFEAYQAGRKAPLTRAAGSEFADPTYELSLDWLAARDAIRVAAKQHADPSAAARVLVVAGGARNEHTCPGERSKTDRLVERARAAIAASGIEVDVLDLCHLTAEAGRVIYPCKACVSTAMPLCHWPCSCYPNHGLGQTGDWMNELYPRWVARARDPGRHAGLLVPGAGPAQAPDRPAGVRRRRQPGSDLDRRQGSRPRQADRAGRLVYPRHLAGRTFGVVVHGDADGVETLRRSLTDWLREMELVPAGAMAELGRYVGYYEPYATSHDALDRDDAFMVEVANAARTLVAAVRAIRGGQALDPGAAAGLESPRPK